MGQMSFCTIVLNGSLAWSVAIGLFPCHCILVLSYALKTRWIRWQHRFSWKWYSVSWFFGLV